MEIKSTLVLSNISKPTLTKTSLQRLLWLLISLLAWWELERTSQIMCILERGVLPKPMSTTGTALLNVLTPQMAANCLRNKEKRRLNSRIHWNLYQLLFSKWWVFFKIYFVSLFLMFIGKSECDLLSIHLRNFVSGKYL